VKRFHPNEYHTSRFECDICDKSYQWKESLTRHKKYKHSNKVKVVKLPKSSITIRNKKVACTDPEVTVVDTTEKVTAADPLDDVVAIVDQFIGYFTSDKSMPANVTVQRLIKETNKELRHKTKYYTMMGNVWRLAFETERKFPLLDFIDELTGTVRHDYETQYDFKWMVMMFTMGRELLRIMPSYRREVEEMLLYFLLRADQDLTMLGGWERFNNNCTKYEFPVMTL